tara:strand:+ start:375 stop:587 length:213 start_codon:yes stop_codon:yes gene_type:complete
VPWVVIGVVQLVTGLQTVLQDLKDVAFNQALGAETLQWVTTQEPHIDLMDSTVTVTITKVFQLVLHSSEL